MIFGARYRSFQSRRHGLVCGSIFVLLFLATELPSLSAQDRVHRDLGNFLDCPSKGDGPIDYRWTTDHLHVGVRWQPFIGRPENNQYDALRPVLSRDSKISLRQEGEIRRRCQTLAAHRLRQGAKQLGKRKDVGRLARRPKRKAVGLHVYIKEYLLGALQGAQNLCVYVSAAVYLGTKGD